MSESDIDLIESELGVELPPAYRSWLLTLPSEFDNPTSKRIWTEIGHIYNQPEQIIGESLNFIDSDCLSDTEWEDWDLSDYIAIGGDGCGNYYIIERDDEDPVVHLLSHDPLGIEEEKFASVAEYCAAIDQIIR